MGGSDPILPDDVASKVKKPQQHAIENTCIWQGRGVVRIGGPPSPAVRTYVCLAGSKSMHRTSRIGMREALPLDSMHQNESLRQESSRTCATSQVF